MPHSSENAKAQDNDILRESELFNSFFADDLCLVEHAMKNKTFGNIPNVKAQGEKAWQLIKKAFELSDSIPNLFVITPFKTVKNGLKKFILSQPKCKQDSRFAE